jgi:aerobic carbon-monoxide dehydrogenase large subunit
MAAKAFGQRLVPAEAKRFVAGGGAYVDDLPVEDALHTAFVRSPFAHARILSLNLEGARSAPRVAAVFGASDLGRAGEPLPYLYPHAAVEHPKTQLPLADGEVFYAGQVVAMVVAEDRYAAEDAAELVLVDYDPLPPVVNLEVAADEGAQLVHSDLPSNVAAHFTQRCGDPDNAFADAEVVIRERFEIERSAGMPMEPRGLAARWEPGRGELTLWDSTQNTVDLRDGLARRFGLRQEQVRVVAPDVGGGFGTKIHIFYPDEVLIPFAAMELGRPVKFIEDRSEHFVGSHHERKQVHEIELAATRAGDVIGLRDSFLHDTGAFIPQGLQVCQVTATQLPGPYRIPNLEVELRAVYTTTVPVTPYRGSGRPHACFVIELTLDRLATELGLDRVEIRRRNFIRPDEFPYAREPLLFADDLPVVLDSGDYEPALDKALERIGHAGFAAEQEAARAEGRHLGLGLACYVEATGLGPFEAALAQVDPDRGGLRVSVAVPAQGQAHATTLAQVAADGLGVEPGDVEIQAGDTGRFAQGVGTYASRTAVVAGTAVHEAVGALRDRLLEVAAERLGVGAGELEIGPGRVAVRGRPEHGLSFAELGPLEASGSYAPPHATWASGVHACVVEVDLETLQVNYRRYVAVHDCGNVINPGVVEGQVLGGIAQGVGGALYERLEYDDEGQIQNASFMDFLIPYATEVPAVEVEHETTPSPLNPLGMKGAGEAGTIPVPAVTAAAVQDALAPFGVRITEAPLDPNRLHELLESAGAPGFEPSPSQGGVAAGPR